MSTTYNTTSSKDTKDKDSTETYVSDSTKTTTGKGKQATGTVDTDRTHDTESTTQYGKNATQYGTTFGQGQQQQQFRGQQDTEGQRGGQQMEIQQKLKEVGNLLQRAGHILQELQCSSGDFQFQSSTQSSRGTGGNFNGPYGMGYESQSYGSYGGASRYEQDFPRGGIRYQNRDEDREDRLGFRSERGFGGRHPEESRFESSRVNSDRFGGFGGPNRPDLAYGEQYGREQTRFGGSNQFETRRPNW